MLALTMSAVASETSPYGKRRLIMEVIGSMPFELIVALCIVVAIAAVSDIRLRRIPNKLLVAGLALALVGQVVLGGWNGLSTGLIGFAVGLGLMLPGWLLKFTGGGDVKLMAVVGAYVGSPTVLVAFALSVMVGAIVGVLYGVYVWAARGAASPLTRYGAMLTAFFATGRIRYIRPDETEALGRRFPLAPAIALGSVGAAIWFS
jgi:prepilin peptidase CpaA